MWTIGKITSISMQIFVDKHKNQLTEPCSNCVSQVMCLHKDWMTILDICKPIKDYIAVLTKGNKNLNEPYGVMVDIKSIGHIFTVHATRKGRAILIGKYWSPTIKKDGYIDDATLASEAQKYALHPIAFDEGKYALHPVDKEK